MLTGIQPSSLDALHKTVAITPWIDNKRQMSEELTIHVKYIFLIDHAVNKMKTSHNNSGFLLKTDNRLFLASIQLNVTSYFNIIYYYSSLYSIKGVNYLLFSSWYLLCKTNNNPDNELCWSTLNHLYRGQMPVYYINCQIFKQKQ